MEGRLGAGHLEHHVHPVAVGHGPQAPDDVVARVDGLVGAHAAGHGQALGVDVGGEDRGARLPCARWPPPSGRSGPQPRTATLCAGDLLHEGGMHGIAHRLLERRDLGREASLTHALVSGMTAYCGEGARRVHAQDAQVLAHVGAPGAALVAGPVHEVGLRGDQLAERHARRRPGRAPRRLPAISWPKIIGRPEVLLGPRDPSARCGRPCRRRWRPATLTRTSPGPGFGNRHLARRSRRARPLP